MTADWGFGFRGLLYGWFVSEYCSYCESYVRGSYMSGYASYRYMPTQRTCIVATSLSSRLIFTFVFKSACSSDHEASPFEDSSLFGMLCRQFEFH